MTLTTEPLDYPATCNPELAKEQFGIKITGGFNDINHLSADEFAEIERLLYTHSVVVFPGVDLTPAGQYALTKAFDPDAIEYGHGAVGRPDAKSILHPDLRNIPSQPAVQLIGNGPIDDARIAAGLPTPVQLKHPSHKSFHRDIVSDEDTAKGFTRFYRWHIDAALYERDPPKATTLYGLKMPTAARQTVRYDDGTGDELDVPMGGTSFISGTRMFDILPANLKSLAVRAKVRYAPHPYVWMQGAKALPTGLGMYSEGKEPPLEDLPPYEEAKIKTLPMTWKNPVTGKLHLQVHPSGVQQLHVAPLPEGASREGALYPDGAHLTDLKQVRELVYSMQRPGIAPDLVYTHDWSPKDLALFHNRGVLHSITSEFAKDEQRAFWQCNLAASVPVDGPTDEDVKKYA